MSANNTLKYFETYEISFLHIQSIFEMECTVLYYSMFELILRLAVMFLIEILKTLK